MQNVEQIQALVTVYLKYPTHDYRLHCYVDEANDVESYRMRNYKEDAFLISDYFLMHV